MSTQTQHVALNMLKSITKTPLSKQEVLNKIKEECHNSATLLYENLTPPEQCRVAFVPLVITNIAWRYADLVLQEVATLKIECLKKLARSMRELKKRYNSDILMLLNYTRRQHIETETDKCLKDISLDITRLFFSVNHEFKRTTPDYPYDRMRSHAVIGKLLIDYLVQYNKQSDELITQRLGKPLAPTQIPLIVENLGISFEAFAGVGEKFDWQAPYITTAMKVIDNRIKQMEFSILNENEHKQLAEMKAKAKAIKKDIRRRENNCKSVNPSN